ncbi:quinoprotein dehydrogenase-associated SoxYZ-like carrier [Pararhizobium haloflavum]|uniref:quinoprotein dehydrogenase-associated SoxYZ-like carrier n=1 Tax=Pararhizobium haloflavum TaxID=2037914 RepID=UPI000C1788B1|nr:quinoprotein dehydrogenase-associated SoxYZ-like carrier [Pararhizobium haloflavum]
MMRILLTDTILRQPLLALAALCLLAVPAAAEDSKAWDDIRASLFGSDRAIHDGRDVISMEAPDRALDAALVPISVTAEIDQSKDRYIKAITLVIDENPAPVVGTFHLSPDNGIADISTRVRVNAYTSVRAIAEMNDGQLYMAERFVKASGGCAAPATKDAELAMQRLGQMRMKQIGTWREGEPSEVQLMVSHPNYSGLQTDQVTQLWIPAHYVRTLDVTLGDRPVLRFEGDISMSENPTIRFFVEPEGEGALTARAVDTKDNVFEESWPIRLEPST